MLHGQAPCHSFGRAGGRGLARHRQKRDRAVPESCRPVGLAEQQVQADLEVGLDLKLELERSAEDLAGGAGGDGAFGACGGGGDPEEEGYGYTIDDYDADDESVMELRCIQVSTNQT